GSPCHALVPYGPAGSRRRHAIDLHLDPRARPSHPRRHLVGPAVAIILAAVLRALIESVAHAVGGDDDLLPGGVSMGAISLRLSGDLLSAQASDRYIVLRNAVQAPSGVAAAFSIPAGEVKPLVAALRKEAHVLLFVSEGEVSVASTQEDRPPLGSFRADEAATALWKSLSHVQYAQGEQMN